MSELRAVFEAAYESQLSSYFAYSGLRAEKSEKKEPWNMEYKVYIHINCYNVVVLSLHFSPNPVSIGNN